jgi:tRNA threonylcarbamoyladenosine biosynthesis protein TsaE
MCAKVELVVNQLQEETLEIISYSAQQTQHLGEELAELLQGGELLLLEGQLGTGKTTFTQGLARGLGITTIVSSPTFTLLKEYTGQAYQRASKGQQGSCVRPALYHFDLYRLEEPEEILDLGFEEYFYNSGVSVVEWADKAGALWPPERLYIRLHVLNETQRSLTFKATGERYCEIVRQFQKKIYAAASS